MFEYNYDFLEEADEEVKQEDGSVNISRGGSSIHSKRLDDIEADGGDDDEDAKYDVNEEEEEKRSNNYDTDVPITNLGMNSQSTTQSIASSLQGIAT